ncbi:MAG: M1 family aminopeptidase [Saprospiraceae bacterium]
MFLDILKFELTYRLKRPATWAYFGLLLVFGFILAANGANSGSEKAFVNAPVVIINLIVIVSIFGTMIASAVMGVPVYRDIEHGVKDYYFTYPVKERNYLLGRYAGSLMTLFLISTGLIFGLMIGYALGPVLEWENPERFGPFQLGSYVQGMLVMMWPNLFFVGTLFFCLVALTRKIFISYVGSVLFFILYLVAGTLASDVENLGVVALLDPFGSFAFGNDVRYLTPPEQNAYDLSLSGDLLINRIIWPLVGLALLGFTLFRFDFTRFLDGMKGKVKRAKVDLNAGVTAVAGVRAADVVIPHVQQTFSTGGYLNRMRSQAWIEFKSILRDPYFFGIVGGAILFLFLDGWFGNVTYGTRNLPTTWAMLDAKDGTYVIFVFIILVFYTGEVVHRDRTVKFDQISDALPMPNWAIYGGKLLTMLLVSFLLATMPLIIGVFSQTIQGFFAYDFGQYFADLYLITWPFYVVLMTLAFFIHVLVNSKFLGHVVAIGTYVAIFASSAVLEIDYNLFIFGGSPGYLVSDMNGLGHFLGVQSWFNAYWLAFGGILIILGGLFYARGTDNIWRSRFRRFGQDWGLKPGLAIAGCLAIFLFSGSTIYRNVSVDNDYFTQDEQLDRQERLEKTYRARFFGFAQPKITDVDVKVDLFPETRSVTADGNFRITNKTGAPIDTIVLEYSYDEKEMTTETFTVDGRKPTLVMRDDDFDLEVYHLERPLQPGDSVMMQFVIAGGYGSFPNEGFQQNIVYNGTFLNNSIFPSFGYSGQAEISSDLERKKRGLEVRDFGLPPADDPVGKSNLLFGDDADFVTFSATISTSPDQIAIAPGKLIREYEENGRRYFEYANEGKMQNFFNISSARYEVGERTWENGNGRDVKIQIFHDAKHDRNITRYLDAVEESLEYYSDQFGPYQFDQLRVLEFPRYSTFAQSFPNTVPYAESFGWTGDFSDPTDNDYAFTVTAHEVAHQWWGHQIAPSATRGANQISESMAEYSSLMVTKKRYGDASMGEFLKYELDNYLRSRAGESKFEKTLLDNDNQAYVWYRKGGLILYALQDYVGEERLNSGFAAMIDSFAMKETAPFATTEDWYYFINSVTPDSLRYFVKESFEGITIYENKAVEAKYGTQPDADGKYRVTIKVNTEKVVYEGSGEEKSRPTERSLIEIGVFAEDGTNEQGLVEKRPLYLEKVWLTPGEHTLELLVDKVPVRAGIDPYNKLIDRISDDNLIDVDAE